MIDVQAAYIQAYLKEIHRRVAEAAIILEWAAGDPDYKLGELLPIPEGKGLEAWKRLQKQVQTLGPRAVRLKRAGAIGDVNWGGKNPRGIDKKLRTLKLRDLVRYAFTPLLCNGITAGWAYKDEATGKTKLQRLGGYLEPLYDEGDEGGEVVGLMQVQTAQGRADRYRVRIYDFQERTIRQWDNLANPGDLGTPYDKDWTDAPMPRICIFDKEQSGLPVGEMQAAMNIMRAEVAQQIRTLRNAEGHIFSIIHLAGKYDKVEQLGTNTILRSPDASSKAERLPPGDMEPQFILHDRISERFRGDMNLPIASIPSGNWPSGEALTQANIAYLSSCQDYALLLSEWLTDLVQDYAALENVQYTEEEAPLVSVSVNREAMRQIISTQVRDDYKAGIIPKRAAVVAIAPYYPGWSDEEIEKWLLLDEQALELKDEPADFAHDDE